MRYSVAACVLGALGAMAGGWLVGRWCLGVVLIVLSGLVITWGVLRDDGEGHPVARAIPGQPQTVAEVFERARRAS